MFNRLQTRIVLLFALLFVGVQALTSFAVYTVTTTNITSQITQQLSYSAGIVQKTLEDDVNQLAEGTRLLSSDFGFRTAVATSDYPTILSALENLVNRIGADSALLISLEEEILADTFKELGSDPLPFNYPNLIEDADFEGQAASFIIEGGTLYELVVLPVLAPLPVAWVGIRLEVDDIKARQIQSILPEGIDISFAIQNSDSEDWGLISSTLERGTRGDLLNQITPQNEGLQAPQDITFGGQDYMALLVDFPSSLRNENVRALLQYSVDVAFSPYEPLIFALATLIAIGLMALIGGSMFISRGVTKPISKLAKEAKRIEEGNYEPVEPLGRKDEVYQLATSFNEMIEGISQREEKIIHQSEHDIATGLPNRIKFEKHIDKLVGSQKGVEGCFSLLEVSINRFGDIRNTVGFSISEALVKEVGPRLNSLARESDLIARLSSSRFIIALPNVSSKKSLSIGKRIIKGFEKPFVIGDCTIDVMIRVGISAFPDHGLNTEDLLQSANVACFQSKGVINHLALYDAEKDQHDADKLSLMSELRRALEEESDELKFFYQPKIDLKKGRVTHVEALVRWIHPERGFVGPDDFIPMAEQTGHIHHLTLWALETGILQVSQWQNKGLDIKLAINLSARDLTNKDLPKIIDRKLKKYKAHKNWLVLEVTESAVMSDPDLALSVLNALNDMGLTLSIDDYGTGYSSMAYLKQLPVKEIKIDKSFVLNLSDNKDDEIIVKSTIELGHNLGLKVTAEGVEDQNSLDILKGHGCDLAQGFYLSRPVPIQEFDEFLSTSQYGLKP